MTDYDPDLESDEQEDEPEVSAELLEEFESRVAQEDCSVVATPIAHELYPFLTRAHFTADWEALYGEARALERSHKNFHIYRVLLQTAVSTKRPVLEQMMWRLEAVRRVGHATTHSLTLHETVDGDHVPTHVSPWQRGIELTEDDGDGDRIASIASAHGLSARIHELLDRAALRGLDQDADKELADTVRSSEKFLPRASARLRQIDTARAQAIASEFRRMSSHPAFAEWYAAHYADYVDKFGDPTRSVAQLLDETWIASVRFNRRDSPLRKAEYAIKLWNSEVEDLSAARATASIRPGDARENPADVPDTLTGHVWNFSTKKPLFRLVVMLTILVLLLVSIGPLQAVYEGLVRERQCESARAQWLGNRDSRRNELLAGADPDSRQSLSDSFDHEMIQIEENFVRVCAESAISLECIRRDSHQYRSDHCRRDRRSFWRQVVAD